MLTKYVQLEAANMQAQAALKEATEMRIAKEGEVTFLRQNIEKVSERIYLQLLHFSQIKI